MLCYGWYAEVISINPTTVEVVSFFSFGYENYSYLSLGIFELVKYTRQYSYSVAKAGDYLYLMMFLLINMI